MNNLQNEKSPYLLQHLENPVDWYPWGDNAFERAREENRLVFLSIGYSTCHWCHVMAHESFEDRDVATLLNQDYISIKVDREERPDIDQVYMEVCQRLTGHGGWPLTVIMTPEARPFYAATYIPKQGRDGRPGMMELLPWVAEKWQLEPEFLKNSADEVVALLQSSTESSGQPLPSVAVFSDAVRALKVAYDQRYGGFSRAPKFPRPHDLVFLLNQYADSGDKQCLKMVERSLLAMRCGGLYDQLGFGFHRYSTDEKWLLPHFEKMLYDQAGLMSAYLAAWQLTKDEFYANTVRETVTYLQRDLLSDKGGFFSAEDADSEGEEGKFYVWSHTEISAVLEDCSESFCQAYNVTPSGNYHDEVTGRRTGKNILHISADHSTEASGMIADFSRQCASLLEIRSERVRPHLDDKVISAWNGMALSALAESARLLGVEDYARRAERLAEFLLQTMNRDGRLHRRYRDEETAVQGFAEDYAYVAKGLLDLYNSTFEVGHLLSAADIARNLCELFQDKVSGRLYDTAHDAEKLLIRPSSAFDGAMPAAASVALEVFARLYLLSGDKYWREAGESLLGSLSAELKRYPAGYTALLDSARWLLKPTREIVIAGKRDAPLTAAMLSAVRSTDLRQTVIIYNSGEDELLSFAPYLRDMSPELKEAVAYVCSQFSCQTPVTDPAALRELLLTAPA